jgi:ribonuclease HI
MITLWFDGLFRGVPLSKPVRWEKGGAATTPVKQAGFMCYGWLIMRGETILAQGHGACARGRDATSNVAEYIALIEGLDALVDLNPGQELVEIRGDAKCVIEQMQGTASVHSPTMKPLHRRASQLVQRFEKIHWKWAPRRHNRNADSLTRRAMRQIRLNKREFQQVIQAIDPGPGMSRRATRKLLPLMDLRVYWSS